MSRFGKRLLEVCLVVVIVAIGSFSACAEQIPESVSYSRTVEGSCKPGALDSNGEWDCRPADSKPTCLDGKIGLVSDELKIFLSDGKPLLALEAMIQQKIQSQGLAETVSWLACQGFDVYGTKDYSNSPSAPKILAKLNVHVWLQSKVRGDLESMMLDWQATKDSLYCILWIFCGIHGEFHMEFLFDRTGNIKSINSYYSTEGP